MAKRAAPKTPKRKSAPKKAAVRSARKVKAAGRKPGSRPAARPKVKPARPRSAKRPARAGARRTPTARKTARRTSAGAARLRRRTDDPTVPTPPSSLNLNRRGSAARTGRAELAEHQADFANLTPAITAGDPEVNVENAYFSGDEVPGGDNQTPDQDRVDDIGKALGVEYQDDEELHSGEKVAERDRHRWELDPASAEDYRDRVQSEEKRRRGPGVE